jgi:serine-type D-Ala-D-Ala carboxypeptidase (penicillin-binding protein 5/6)
MLALLAAVALLAPPSAGAAVGSPSAGAAVGSPSAGAAVGSPSAGAAVGSPSVVAAPGPALNVTGACLAEASTGQVLYTFGANGRLAIASATKLMTALVVLDREPRLGRTFVQNDYFPASGDSQIGLVPGERMSVHDLLVAMMLPSADDAAEDLAYNVGGGSVSRFVAMMNAQARALGLTHTHYSTPIGLDTPGNYSSPCDLVKLARYDLAHSAFFRRIVALPAATLRSGRYSRRVVNRNDLVARVPWINGVKTGHTLGAGYVLVASGTQAGMTLVGAVLGTVSEGARDANALALLGYGFAHFHLAQLVRAGAVMARVGVRDRPGFRAPVIAGASVSRVIAIGARVTTKALPPHQLVGPLPRHAVVGHLHVFVAGRLTDTVPLLLANRLPAVSSLTIAARFLTRPSTLVVVLAVALAALTGLVLTRRERPRAG